jgi:iron complex outermembrane receptor protein
MSLVTLTAYVCSAPASAQNGSVTQLEAVTVESVARETATGPIRGYIATQSGTATKSPTPLIETAASVAVVGAEQIRDQNAQTISEAVRYSPGIRGEQFGSNSRLDFFTIRGFKADDTGLYRDGLQLFSTNFANFRAEPFGLERIEILRGPASVLFGSTAPGGLVNLISKRPTEEQFAYAETGGGSYGRLYSNFDISGPANVEKTLLYRLTAVGRLSDTQVTFSKDDRLYIAPSFTYRPSADTSLTVLMSYQQDNSNSVGGFLPYLGTVRRTAIGAAFTRIPTSFNISDYGVDGFQRRQALLGYEFEHRFSDVWTVRQNLRYNYLDISDKRLYGGGWADAAQTQLTRFNFSATPRVNLFTVDNQAEARFSTGPLSHTVLAGIDYKNYHLTNNEAFSFGPPISVFAPLHYQVVAPVAPYLVAKSSLEQVGLYLQDQIRFDRFVLTISGREDFAHSRVDNRQTFASASRDDSAFSGKVALLYNSEIGLAPYATYSNSFTPVTGTNFLGNLYKPETGEEVEVGVKYQPTGWNSFVTVSAFDLRRNNVQTVDPTNIFNSVQTGQQRSTGMEFQAVSNPIEGLKIVGAYTTYDLRITKDNNVATIGLLPVATPEDYGAVWADYTFQDGDLRGFGFGGGVRYVGRSFADATNTLRVPDFTLFDAAIHYEKDAWRFQVNAQNIADRVYVSSCSDANSCFYGDRRRVTASLSYRW